MRARRSGGDWMVVVAAPPMGAGARVPGFKREFIFPLLLLKEEEAEEGAGASLR